MGDSEASILYSIVNEEPKSLEAIKSNIPDELRQIIYRTLKKKKESRYQAAEEIQKDLKRLRNRLGKSEAGFFNIRSFSRLLRRPVFSIPAAVIIASVAILAILFFNRQAGIRWARYEAIPEIERLVNADERISAFHLARQVETILPENPELHRLFKIISYRYDISTTPQGAEVYLKDYRAPEEEWEHIGITPIENVRVPAVYLHFKIVKEGFLTVERVRSAISRSLSITLDPEEASPPGMVQVSRGKYRLGSLDPVVLQDYWLDKFEVTNNEYKQFVDAGGYQKREYWEEVIIRKNPSLSWKETMSEFKDRTGRPGPATWEFGTFSEGQEDYPVSGVSWYEAAAYARFVDKRLPTIYHWNRASSSAGEPDILKLSNFTGEGPAKVGSYRGLSAFGNYDMAGNIKEWCWNEAQGQRYIIGGSWKEPPYMFTLPDCKNPMDRSLTNGFRCMKVDEPLSESLLAPVDSLKDLVYDYSEEMPVGDEIYQAYRNFYSYDRTDLNAEIESEDISSPHWKKEKITFNAAYGDERVIAYIFLPKGIEPPFQTVVFFPGGEGIYLKSFDDIPMAFFDFIIRSGRALVYPVYKGLYQRGPYIWLNKPSAFRGQVIHQYKDLARSIDYLETREDIDHKNLAYCGFSLGGTFGPIFTALEERFKVSVLLSGGFLRVPSPEVHSLHFAPRSKTPTLMINGKDDFGFPLETSQIPMFRLLGAPEKDKRHVVLEGGHIVPRLKMIKETLDWFDRYLGPVK
jgi:hypothetical protein